MTDRLMECITNPVKCKLLLEIHSQGKATAKQLADIYTDIPQATLYRHLKKMLSDGILQVVEETQVRGTVEKNLFVGTQPQQRYRNNRREKFRRTLYAVFHAIFHWVCKTVSGILPLSEY